MNYCRKLQKSELCRFRLRLWNRKKKWNIFHKRSPSHLKNDPHFLITRRLVLGYYFSQTFVCFFPSLRKCLNSYSWKILTWKIISYVMRKLLNSLQNLQGSIATSYLCYDYISTLGLDFRSYISTPGILLSTGAYFYFFTKKRFFEKPNDVHRDENQLPYDY